MFTMTEMEKTERVTGLEDLYLLGVAGGGRRLRKEFIMVDTGIRSRSGLIFLQS